MSLQWLRTPFLPKDPPVPQVKIPPPYRGPTGGRAAIEVAADSVRGCIDAVDSECPGFGELVLDADGRLQKFVTLFVNGDEIARDALDTAVRADDEIEVLAAVAGG
jgi:molybdopterin converting factor small subunit